MATESSAVASSSKYTEIDIDENGDGFDDDDFSETTSIASSLLKGHIENGRKYSTLRDDYWGPSDAQQFETMDLFHFFMLLLESHTDNPLYKAPVANPTNILDIGTGPGTWAIDVADKFPECNVVGVDLFPPPQNFVPRNCQFEVEDVTKTWTWRQRFDLVHMRLLLGAFTDDEWNDVYQRCYDNLLPGGYIEQIESDVRAMSDDGSLAKDSIYAGWGHTFIGCAKRGGRPIDIQESLADRLKKAGFVDVQEQLLKVPIGPWAKDTKLKEAGRVNLKHWNAGLEGWAMFLLTKFGTPQPWTADEVRAYCAKMKTELNDKNTHAWHWTRRVWARKPTTAE